MGGRLEDKHVLVTGGARGIGEAIVRRFVAEGARVIVADILVDQAATLVAELGQEAEARRLDVTVEQDWSQLAGDLRHDPVDVLVNNAGGLLTHAPLHELAVADWHRVIELNLTSVFLGMRFLVPLMLQNGGGSIINMSSTSGVVGQADAPGYQAAKGGVRMLTRNAAMTYATKGIRVNSILPGIIDTRAAMVLPEERTRTFLDATPMGHAGRPVDVAYAAVYLASDESEFVTGADLYVDGGLVAH